MKMLTLSLLFGTLAAPAIVSAQATALEHFQCYSIRKAEPDPNASVGLIDQFKTPEDVKVLRARRFCNPTRKIDENGVFSIADVRQHLTFYATDPQEGPLRWVIADNQFGRRQVLYLREPIALAVPTHKPPHDRPKGLDHFRCYAASGAAVNKPVRLSDQFILPLTGHFVINPTMFCNPVQKRHNNQITPIENPDDHLTCYSMTRVPFGTERQVRNQFGAQTFAVGPPDTLCVPSRKLLWGQIADAPTGPEGLQGVPAQTP